MRLDRGSDDGFKSDMWALGVVSDRVYYRFNSTGNVFAANTVFAGTCAGHGADWNELRRFLLSCMQTLAIMTECRYPFDVPGQGKHGVGKAGQHEATASNLKVMKNLKKASSCSKKVD